MMLVAGIAPVLSGVHAASLTFNPSTVTTAVDKTFQLQVVVNAGDKEVLGVDARGDC